MRDPESDERLNFNLLALQSIFIRIGWVFKTESVIIPAFLDSLGATSWQRGLLPTISRIGQSVPQFLVAQWISGKPIYKSFAIASSILQVVPWVAIALLLYLPHDSKSVILWLFFLIYAFHWVANGSSALVIGALQGKLVETRSRGKLLAVSNFAGCILSVIAAWLFMPQWINLGDKGYAGLFMATAIGFLIAAFFLLPTREGPSPGIKEPEGFWHQSVNLIRRDANVRRLVGVVLLIYASFLLFPHYEPFGSRILGVKTRDRVNMVIVQNLMNAFGSAFIGPLGDRRGNRMALSVAVGMIGFAPLTAVAMSWLPHGIGQEFYWIVFALIGFNPVTQRILVNYVLEVAPEGQHPLYLGTINLVQAVPLVLSPIVGLAIDYTSFQAVFIVFAAIMFAGCALSVTLQEPRTARREDTGHGDMGKGLRTINDQKD